MLEKKVNELENKVKYGEFLLSKTKNKMKNLFNQIPTIKESYTLKANYGIKLAQANFNEDSKCDFSILLDSL